MMMRGASAEALADLQDRLRQALGSADAARVGDDLFGVASVLRSEAGLRRVATDVSTDAEAKVGLVRSIFDGKVDAVSLDLVSDAVRRRWTATRDLPDTLERLSEEAVVRSAGSRRPAGHRRAVRGRGGRPGQPRRCATRWPTPPGRSRTGPAWSTGCSATRRCPRP